MRATCKIGARHTNYLLSLAFKRDIPRLRPLKLSMALHFSGKAESRRQLRMRTGYKKNSHPEGIVWLWALFP